MADARIPAEGNKPEEPHNKHLILILVVVIVLVAIGYFFRDTIFPERKTQVPTEFTIAADGTLYLTLLPLTGSNAGGVQQLYAYDIGADTPRKIDGTGSYSNYAHFSADEGRVVLVSVPATQPAGFDENMWQLYLVDVETRDSTQLTASPTYFKRFPQWSPDGTQIAFMAQPEYAWDSQQALPADAYSVYVADLLGNETKLTEGAYPHWTPGGDLVFLKTDGLYLYRMETGEEELIWESQGGPTNVAMSINVAPDGSRIVWSAPNASKIALMSVESWEPFEGRVTITIVDTRGYWPVFSEDSNLLALQVAEGDITDLSSPHSLRIYELDTLRSQTLMRLDGHSLRHTVLSDWRELSGNN